MMIHRLLLIAAVTAAPVLADAGGERPMFFAHRGGAREFEENTMSAFRGSYEAGIRGFELDVRMTGDGKLVVLHDDSLDRTHHGSGPVEALDSSTAAAVTSRVRNEPLLFLDTLLDYLADKPGLYVEFEMKTGNRTLYPDARIDGFAKAVHGAVTSREPEGSTWVFTSFDERPLKAVRKIDPSAEIMLIKGGPLDDSLLAAAEKIGARRVACKMEGTTRLAVREAQGRGFIVTGWPGHDLDDLFLGLGLGVDAICSDVPLRFKKTVDALWP